MFNEQATESMALSRKEIMRDGVKGCGKFALPLTPSLATSLHKTTPLSVAFSLYMCLVWQF